MKEQILIAIYKDSVIPSYQFLIKKYPKLNISQVRAEVIDYQIEKYGFQLCNNYIEKTQKQVQRCVANRNRNFIKNIKMEDLWKIKYMNIY